MYNLFFFCKGTKLKRKRLQTVFHTKERKGDKMEKCS